MCLHFVSGGLGATPLRTSGVAPGLTPFAIQLAALAPEAFRKMSVNREQFQSSSKLPAGCPGWCLLVPSKVSSGSGTKVGGNIQDSPWYTIRSCPNFFIGTYFSHMRDILVICLCIIDGASPLGPPRLRRWPLRGDRSADHPPAP